MEHNKLNIERKSKGVGRGFFLSVWIRVDGITDCDCCILWKVRYATMIKRETRKGDKALSSEIKLDFPNIIDWN